MAAVDHEEDGPLVQKLRAIMRNLSPCNDQLIISSAAAAIERLHDNLDGRDKFIGDEGLWDKFVASLPKSRGDRRDP